ncbi:hypothetical protein [Chryseobacterium ginsenosidimutans]|uniref:hypothetical protein n=1 Tax=Chryseobacterium ginsenosidimutans TaxID=687846 RepID=UPI0031E2ECB5
MKIYLVAILSMFSSLSLAQNCSCATTPNLNEIISCEKTTFKNGAKIYRQFDCNSSWLIFEDKNKKKKTLFSLDKELIELTEKLDFVSWTEYRKSFLIENRLISGCCDPSEFILFDKNNGEKISDLGREIFHSQTDQFPFFVSIDSENSDYLTFLNLDTNKIFKINLPKNRIKKTLEVTSELFIETLFEEGQIINGVFEIKYKYKKTEKDKWHIEKVFVDLKKHIS